MKLTKKTLLGAVMALYGAALCHAGPKTSVEIKSTDNKTYSFDLARYMKFTFNEEANFIVYKTLQDENGDPLWDQETGKDITETLVEFPGVYLEEMVFKPEDSGVDSPVADCDVRYDIASGTLRVKGSETVFVYSASGMMEGAFASNGEDTVVISMNSFGEGVHLVKVGSQTIKLLVK